jgi:anti-sigma factor RsiW
VSILSGLRRTVTGGHLDDDAIAEIWADATTSGEPSAHPHLAACPQCRGRYAAFVGWLDGLQHDARDEADEAFPPERLAMQQAQVLRRLETLERPARVIAFPRFSRPVTSTQGHAQRWIAAAAAAGLLIGLAAGQFVDIRDAFGGRGRLPAQTTQTARVIAPPATAPVVTPASATSVSDEQIFFGDGAQDARLSALLPMDDITPRARDERP